MVQLRDVRAILAKLWYVGSYPLFNESVPVADVTNIFGCSFAPGGWHPLAETVRELEADLELPVEESTLYRYHSSFAPKHTADALLREEDDFLPLFVYPWGAFSRNQPGFKDPVKSRFCGPSSEEFIREEFIRFKSLYLAIKLGGYRALEFASNQIAGTFLVDTDGRRRFVVMQGNHRVAVLVGLGWRAIPVRVQPRIVLPEVHFADRSNWCFWDQMPAKRDLMERVFKAFFLQDGAHVRERLSTNVKL